MEQDKPFKTFLTSVSFCKGLNISQFPKMSVFPSNAALIGTILRYKGLLLHPVQLYGFMYGFSNPVNLILEII